MLKGAAISHAYIEPYTRIGLLAPGVRDMDMTVLLSASLAKENPQGYETLKAEGYKVRLIRSVFNFHNSVRMYLLGLFRELRRIAPDFVFVNNEPWSMTAFQVVLFRVLSGRDFKIIIYTCENLRRRSPAPFRWFEKAVLKNTDLFLTITESEGAGILREKGYSGQIRYLPLSVDTELFRKEDAAAFKKELLGDSNIFCIGYAGRVVKEKGIETLLEAARNLEIDYRLLLIGGGPFLEELKKKSRERGIDGKVVFQDHVFSKDLPKFINCMDIFVLPSLTTENWKEQFGRVLIEAMACGVAVIGSSSGEIPVVIGDGGIIFSEGDAGDLEKQIKLLFSRQDLRKSLAEKGQKRAGSIFSRKNIFKQTEEIYREILVTGTGDKID